MDRSVDGYLFGSDKDAEIARKESEKILFLENRMNYDSPKSVLAIYNKAIENRVFITPVGFYYLKRLQEYLREKGLGEHVKDIPMYHIFSYSPEPEKKETARAKRVQPARGKGYQRKFAISFLVNLILSALIIFMFAITLTSKNPNILNYENRLVDKYSSWEQELSEREQAVKVRERELNLEP